MNEYKPWVKLIITEVEYWKNRYLESRQINQSQNTELKKLVSELVKVCEWAANIDRPCYKTKCTCVEDGCQIVLSKNKELIEAIKGE